MTNLDSVLKSKNITLLAKVLYSQCFGLPSGHVWLWELDLKQSRAPKNWCFWIVVQRRLLTVPWTARRSNQSILKEVNPEYSLEELMLKLKLQSLGHVMWRAESLEKTLMLGKIEGRRRRGWQRMRWLDAITDSTDEFEQTPGDSEGQRAWCAVVYGAAKSQTRLNDWATTKMHNQLIFLS